MLLYLPSHLFVAPDIHIRTVKVSEASEVNFAQVDAYFAGFDSGWRKSPMLELLQAKLLLEMVQVKVRRACMSSLLPQWWDFHCWGGK